ASARRSPWGKARRDAGAALRPRSSRSEEVDSTALEAAGARGERLLLRRRRWGRGRLLLDHPGVAREELDAVDLGLVGEVGVVRDHALGAGGLRAGDERVLPRVRAELLLQLDDVHEIRDELHL